MSFNLTGGGTRPIKSLQSSDFSLSLSSQLFPVSSGGSSSNSTTNGRVFLTTTSPVTITNNIQLTPVLTGTLAAGRIPNFTWSSSAPSVATINSFGFITYVSNGSSSFKCQVDSPGGVKAAFPFTFTSTGGSTTNVFQNWEVVSPVSLPAHLNSQIDGLISVAGGFSSAKLNLFSSVNDATSTYIRNTSGWFGSVDLSGAAVRNVSAGSVYFLVTLITPTDFVCAKHTGISAGTILRFVDPSNIVFEGTVSAVTNINGDLNIGHLIWNGGSVPSTLKIHPILPSAYRTYWRDHVPNFFPVICLNQFRQVFIQDSSQDTLGTQSSFTPTPNFFFDHNPSTLASRSPWTLAVISGDSGNPIFVIINGEAVLMQCNYTATASPHVGDFISSINSALIGLGSIYAIRNPNLTTPIAFPTY